MTLADVGVCDISRDLVGNKLSQKEQVWIMLIDRTKDHIWCWKSDVACWQPSIRRSPNVQQILIWATSRNKTIIKQTMHLKMYTSHPLHPTLQFTLHSYGVAGNFYL